MRILVNYQLDDKKNMPQLAYFLKRHNLQAAATSHVLEIGQLLDKAKLAGAQAILLCNEGTLANCVSGTKPTLDQYRGSLLKFSIPTIVCNRLEHINSVPYGSWLLEQDLIKFSKLNISAPPFECNILETSLDFALAYEELKASILMALDIETSKNNEDKESIQGPDSLITCISWTALLKNGKLKTYVLPFIDFGVDHWETDEEYACAIKLMQDINKLPVPKVMQNGIYDAVHLIRYHAEPYNWTLDTMALSHAEFSELPKTLDFLASRYLPYYMQWKTEAKLAQSTKDIKRYWGYNGRDTWYTLLICMEQLRTMPPYAKANYADKFKLVYPSLYCSFEGWKIDQEKRTELRKEAQIIYDKSLADLRLMVADPNFNPGSWQQVAYYIYEVFGAKHPKVGKSKAGTDEKCMKAVGEQHPLLAKITEAILDYRGAQKAIGTYFDFYQLQGRLLYALNPFGAETERMACQASSLWVGTQVQNIPKYAKPMLVADEGYEAFEIDNKQSEARCTAYMAKEEALIEAIEDPIKDFYRTLGTLFFQMQYEEVSDFFRNKVLKKIVHGTNYMMQGKTFLENIGAMILFETAPKLGFKIVEIPRKNHPEEYTLLQFSKYLLEIYHAPFPRVREWYKEVYHEIAATGRLVSPLGHTHIFFGDITKNHAIFRSAVAHGPQNLSVSVLNKGFWKIYKQLVLPSKGAFRLKAQVHDSVVGQYKIGERDIWLPKAMALMDNPIEVHGRTLRIPLDAEYGPNWKDKTPYKGKEN